ncbi:bile acid:sodium symporter family protein [Neisseriaceae bacterium PsAf]|nr:bile acid:sodium symporter family protein [Neisseriaceae bacterium PsAf]
MQRLTQFFFNYFSIVIILLVVVSLLQPEWFTWIAPYINYLLASVMFLIGLSLSQNDFKAVMQAPKGVILCLLSQYLIMPLVALLLIYLFKPNTEVATGLILVGCCPGGTASNIMTYLAKGNVSLSVCATTLSTLLAPIMTPFLLYLFAGQWIEISVLDLFTTISLVIIIPVLMGFWLSITLKELSFRMKQWAPSISIILVAMIVCAITGLNAETMLLYGLSVIGLVILHNLIGLFLGYAFAQLFNLSRYDSKAIAIETGMQNSGLAGSIALQFFSPLSALPSALFSIWHNISGSILANYWGKQRAPIVIVSRKITPKNFTGITLYPFIFCSHENYLSDTLINHEQIHIAQQRELLLIGFYLIYVIHYLINLIIYRDKQKAYANIVFEREAYANEDNLNYLENRKLWAFIPYFKKNKGD